MNSSGIVNVYVDTPYYFIARKNTDWKYMHSLENLACFAQIETTYPFSLKEIFNYSASYIMPRFGFANIKMFNTDNRRISYQKLHKHSVDVLLNHSIPPIVDAPVPVVWQSAILDPEMQRANGTTDDELRRQKREFERLLPRATLVQVSTEVEVRRLSRSFPAHAHKFTAVPFFLPKLCPLSAEAVKVKHEKASRLEVLFVGRDGWRKGLDLTLEALSLLSPEIQKRFHFTIVSELHPSKPRNFCVETDYYRFLPHEKVVRLFEQAHIFIMPSRFESFGFVYLEAMAAGVATIMPNWEVQRELSANGTAGLNCNPCSESIAIDLLKLVEDDIRKDLASNGVNHILEKFSPKIVANKYYEMFLRAMEADGMRAYYK